MSLCIFKAKSISEPFAYEEYRKNLIKKKIEEERGNRVMAKVFFRLKFFSNRLDFNGIYGSCITSDFDLFLNSRNYLKSTDNLLKSYWMMPTTRKILAK